jgi:hypothetical protein
MTTRNFRVKNGLSVGDIVISASANTITGLTTSAPSADGDVANKKYVDDSLSGLSQNSISQGDSSVTVSDSGTGTITISADGGTVISTAAAATTITASGNINLTAGADVAIPNDVGVLFGTGGEKIESDGTNLTITSTGDTTLQTTGTTTISGNTYIGGNLTVAGTETIVSTQNLEVEDNIIAVNANVSSAANMPRFSGMHIHRGTGSSATELDLYIVWDEAYDVSGGAGLGGTFSFLGSSHEEGTGTPNSGAYTLADLRCNLIEATATTAQYADIAERFEADAPITPGAVVMLGGSAEITETAEELSDRVFGVISTQPAYMMNNGAGSNDTHPFVAMTGRTPVRVTGEVRKGDRLVSSSIKGTARAASAGETINPFHVIGRALEDKFDSEIGLVNCVVRTNN